MKLEKDINCNCYKNKIIVLENEILELKNKIFVMKRNEASRLSELKNKNYFLEKELAEVKTKHNDLFNKYTENKNNDIAFLRESKEKGVKFNWDIIREYIELKRGFNSGTEENSNLKRKLKRLERFESDVANATYRCENYEDDDDDEEDEYLDYE